MDGMPSVFVIKFNYIWQGFFNVDHPESGEMQTTVFLSCFKKRPCGTLGALSFNLDICHKKSIRYKKKRLGKREKKKENALHI